MAESAVIPQTSRGHSATRSTAWAVSVAAGRSQHVTFLMGQIGSGSPVQASDLVTPAAGLSMGQPTEACSSPALMCSLPRGSASWDSALQHPVHLLSCEHSVALEPQPDPGNTSLETGLRLCSAGPPSLVLPTAISISLVPQFRVGVARAPRPHSHWDPQSRTWSAMNSVNGSILFLYLLALSVCVSSYRLTEKNCF